MHTACRARPLPTNTAIQILLLPSLLWLLSGCIMQSARDESTPATRADSRITSTPLEVAVSPAAAEPNKPKSELDLPKYDTQTAVAKSKPAAKPKPVTKPQPAKPVSTAVIPPAETPDTLQEPEPTIDSDSSTNDQLAMAEPLPDMTAAEVDTAIPRRVRRPLPCRPQ